MRNPLAVGLTVLVAAVTATVVFAQELEAIQAKFEPGTVSGRDGGGL